MRMMQTCPVCHEIFYETAEFKAHLPEKPACAAYFEKLERAARSLGTSVLKFWTSSAGHVAINEELARIEAQEEKWDPSPETRRRLAGYNPHTGMADEELRYEIANAFGRTVCKHCWAPIFCTPGKRIKETCGDGCRQSAKRARDREAAERRKAKKEIRKDHPATRGQIGPGSPRAMDGDDLDTLNRGAIWTSKRQEHDRNSDENRRNVQAARWLADQEKKSGEKS